jgi:hypothetical protein
MKPQSSLRRLARCLELATAIAALPLVLWACQSHPLERPDPLPEQQTDDAFLVNPIRDVDLLFVIDNSGSTANKQANFTRNFPAFMNALQMIPGGLPNVRIGVVDSDYGVGGVMSANGCNGFGDKAAFQVNNTAGAPCGLPAGEFWITNTNVPAAQLNTVFSCMATRGTMGCGHEHSLQAANMALHPRPDRNPMNEGFLRPDAYLAIIILTDEEDSSGGEDSGPFFMNPPPAGWVDNSRAASSGAHICNGGQLPPAPISIPLASCVQNPMPPAGTLLPVSQIVADIKALKPGHEEKIIVASIFGWPLPGTEAAARYTLENGMGGVNLGQVCTQAGGGTPGLRIKAFLDSFSNSSTNSICQDSFAAALDAIGKLVGRVVGNPCVSAPLLDTDPMMAGVQPECIVEDKVGDVVTALPQCSATAAKPCWTLSPSTNCTESGVQISVDRGGAAPATGLQQLIKCRTCAKPGDMRCRKA